MSFSIREAAREAPDSCALVDDRREWSFAEWAEEIGSWGAAHAPGEWSAFDAPRSTSTLALIQSAIECGAPFLPLPRLTALERSRTLDSLGSFRLIDSSRQDRTNSGSTTVDAPADDDRPLAAILTSGSSGAPRAAVLSRRACLVAARASAERLGWRDQERWMLALSPARVAGLSIQLRCLAARKSVVLLPESAGLEELSERIAATRSSLLSLVPTQLDRWIDLGASARQVPSLRAVLVGGAATGPELLARARAAGLPVIPTYGSTETCSQIATASGGDAALRPLPGYELRIEAGAIEVRTAALASGYLPGPTALPLTSDRFFRTRDLGAIDSSGVLLVHGRSDGVLISGGEKVVPEQIEATLEQIDGIKGAIVIGIDDSRFGSLVAALLEAGSAPLPPSELACALSVRLSGAARPRLIAWVEALPTRADGKKDRLAARAHPQFEVLEYPSRSCD